MNNINESINVTGNLKITLRNVLTGKTRISRRKNMVVTYGKNAIAQRLSGQSDVGDITYCAVGTSSLAPALSDTSLVAEVARKLISTRSYSGNVATFTTFFTTSEGNGSLREAGLFGNAVNFTATGTSGTGQLYCRAAINRTKTSNDTLTIQWDVTIG